MRDAILWVFKIFLMKLFLRFCWKSNYFRFFSAGEKVPDIKTLCHEFISKHLNIWQKHLTFKHLTDSSNVNEVIKTISNFFIFYEKILHAQKAENANKRMSNFLPLRCFLIAQKGCLFCFRSLICVLCFLCV